MRRAGLTFSVAALLLAAAPATSQATIVAGGTTTLRIDRGFSKRLAAAGVGLSGVTPGTSSGRAAQFPIVGGQLRDAGVGVLTQKGALKFSGGGRSVILRKLGLSTTHARLSATIGAKSLVVATFEGPFATRDGFGIEVEGHDMHLTPPAAALLNRKLGQPGLFGPNRPFAELAVDAQLVSVKAAGGSINLTLDQGFDAKLKSLGATAAPFEATSQTASPPPAFAIPDIFGAVGSDLTKGTIYTNSDGIKFLPGPYPGARELVIARISLDLDAGLASAWFRIQPPSSAESSPLAAINFSSAALTADTTNGTFTVAPQPIALTGYAAEWLNAALAGPSHTGITFSAGEPFASIGFTVQSG